MITELVMDEIGEKASSITGLNRHPYESDKVTPPSLMVSLPTKIDYEGTYARGMDYIELIVTILVTKVGSRVRRDLVVPYSDGSGPKSLKQLLEKGPHRNFSELTAKVGGFDIITIAKVDYLGFMLTCGIWGSGE